MTIVRDIRDRQAAQARIRQLAHHDTLTGLHNRGAFVERLEGELAHPSAPGIAALLFMDLDHFKRINDTLGHDAGDQILKVFAEVIGQNVRGHDCLARWGGEEFVLVCYQAPSEAAQAIGEKLRLAVAQHTFETQAQSLNVTVSIGVASGKAGESFDKLFKRADVALYKAKAGGRNRVELAEDR